MLSAEVHLSIHTDSEFVQNSLLASCYHVGKKFWKQTSLSLKEYEEGSKIANL